MNNDLIHRSAALAVLEELKNHVASSDPVGEVADAIETMQKVQAVDAEPVRHARWLPTNDDNKKRCSRCDVIHLIAQYPHGQANYCPNCGAKMDA